MKRRILSMLLAAPMLMLLPGVAHAAGGGVVQVVGAQVRYDAVAGGVNTVVVSDSLGLIIVDDVVRVVPGNGCAYLSATDNTVVGCRGNGVTRVLVSLNDRDDRVDHVSSRASTLVGGLGNDILGGGDNNDSIQGGPGHDRMFGHGGADRIDGADGDDMLAGRDGNDLLIGGLGNDRMFGENGDDNLLGSEGNDSLDGGSGNNHLDGGTGLDGCVNGPAIINCEAR